MLLLRRWLIWAVAAVCVAGCQNTSSTPETPSEADEAGRWAMLAARPGPLRDAWAVLESQPHTRDARTEQRREDGLLLAFAERETAFSPAQGRTLARADSGGAFDYGHFQHFTSEAFPTRDPEDLGALVYGLSDEPLLPANAAAYTYRQRPDTLLGGLSVHVFEARAHPTRGDGHNVRALTYFVDPVTNDLVGMRLVRIDLGTFFREESEAEIHLHRLADGTYAPAETRIRVEAIMPFQPRQPVTTTARYLLAPALRMAAR